MVVKNIDSTHSTFSRSKVVLVFLFFFHIFLPFLLLVLKRLSLTEDTASLKI
jgi:hypothetical protein